jgi:outer membrane protein OmpA-like peptidoglycan-associated protein
VETDQISSIPSKEISMQIVRQTILVVGIFLLFSSPTFADDFGFETTKEGIFKALTTPKKAPLFTLRGAGPSGAGPIFKVRGLTIAPKASGQTKVVEKIVSMPRERSGATVNLAIQFAVNSYAIQPKSMPILDNLGAALKRAELQPRVVSVNGHTDSDGSEQHNLQLSLKRAVAVKQYLALNHGVRNAQLRVMGYGEGIPMVENSSVRNKQLNRRVEVSVIPNQ